jgi:hypothetical protein
MLNQPAPMCVGTGFGGSEEQMPLFAHELTKTGLSRLANVWAGLAPLEQDMVAISGG